MTLTNTVAQSQDPAKPATPGAVLVREVRPGEIDEHLSGPDPDDTPTDSEQMARVPDHLAEVLDHLGEVLREMDDEQLHELARSAGVSWNDDKDVVVQDLLRPIAERVDEAGAGD